MVDKISEEDIADLYRDVQRIKKEKKYLEKENKQLKEQLTAKRYKLIDTIVNSVYKVTHLGRKNSVELPVIEDDSAEEQKIEMRTDKKVKRKVSHGRVDLINVTFFDWDGNVVYRGGAERYIYDLACLLKEMGYKPRILQCSNVCFEKKFKGITVIGIGTGSKYDMEKRSECFKEWCNDCEMIIASPLELACKISNIPIIGINHGVNFDGDWNRLNTSGEDTDLYDSYFDALINVKKCVCVDTNFINWTRTRDYRLSSKEEYIPNYCDLGQFENIKNKKQNKNKNKIVFVYARRIYSARGYDLTIEAFREVFKKYKDKVEIHFVGQIDNDRAGKDLKAFMNDFPKNVFHYEYDMEDMANAYKDADVVLIPTRYCEGTSLSCIEGMLSGAAIIVTNVGGLPNLVIDGFNGRIVSPDVNSLTNSIIEMIENEDLRIKFAKNGIQVAKTAFNKEKWQKSWKKEIESVLEEK